MQFLSPNHLVIRTCGLYGVWGSGGKGGNFVETMLRVAGQEKPLRVVSDQRCTPSYTADVAAATVELIARGAAGLFHVVNSGDCTWYEFASEIFQQSGLKPDLKPITSAEFGAAASLHRRTAVAFHRGNCPPRIRRFPRCACGPKPCIVHIVVERRN